MNKTYIIILLILVFTIKIDAQIRCGFDTRHQQLMDTDPVYRAEIHNQILNWQRSQELSSNGYASINGTDTTYIIPCVVHILNTGGALGTTYNPNDASVISMINTVNKILNATETTNVDTNSGGVNMRVQLVLAQRSPTCNSTTGINRINASSLSGYTTYGMKLDGVNGATESSLKNLSKWNNQQYYNIWVVNKIDGFDGLSGSGVAGFAYFPSASAAVDGTVILASFVNSDPTSCEVLAHEFGHAMGLYHTFEGDNGGSICPTNASCTTDGDKICDTDPHIVSYACPTTTTCTGSGNLGITTSRNIMNYANCQDRFSSGQRAFALFNLKNGRYNLINSPTGLSIPNPAVVSACTITNNNPSNNFNMGAIEVKLGGIDFKSSGFSGDNYTAYIDNSCLSEALLKKGVASTINVSITGNPQKVEVYIDYDNNGSFQSTEKVLSGTYSGTSAYTFTGSITPPQSALENKNLRMRVLVDANTATINACGPLTYGQAEDYSVRILSNGTSLPLTKLITFSANWIDAAQSRAVIKWAFSPNHNIAVMEVQKSFNGTDFTTVNVQEAHDSELSYENIDKQTEKANEIYYRLKTTDYDGKEEYGPLALLNMNKTSPWTVWPNPASDYLQITYMSEIDEEVSYRLIDNMGKVITESTQSAIRGMNAWDIYVKDLPAGYYHLNLQGMNMTPNTNIKILVTH